MPGVIGQWDKLEESEEAAHAYEEYYKMGKKRSVLKLATKAENNPEMGITADLKQLRAWFSNYQWQDRCTLRDATALEYIHHKELAKFRDYRMERVEQWDKVAARAIKMIEILDNKLNHIITEDKDMSIEQIEKLTNLALKCLEKADDVQRRELGETAEVNRESEQVKNILNIVLPYLPAETKQTFAQEFSRMSDETVIELPMLESGSD